MRARVQFPPSASSSFSWPNSKLAVRFDSWADVESPPVSSLTCDRPLQVYRCLAMMGADHRPHG